MGLSAFIAAKRETIIQEWVRFASTLVPWAKEMDDEALRDHAGELLDAVVVDMRSPQNPAEQSQKAKGEAAAGGRLANVGQKHASQRLSTGFNLGQLVSEYRALRGSILRLRAEAEGEKDAEATRFHEAIDESLAESTTRYADAVGVTRDQFLAILGHDLRNPLAAITMGAGLLAEDESLDDRQTKSAARMLTSAQRMSRLIDDLLDLTRTRLGDGIPVTREKGDLGLVCEQAIAELAAAYPDSAVTFETKGAMAGEWDGDRIAQVISNLVANALQHGDETGRVKVTAEGKDDVVVVQVWNGGKPIPPELLGQIFEPMARASRGAHDVARHTSGLGLGLYIARQIVVAHGGTLEASSSASEGTTFTAEIPRRAAEGTTLTRAGE